jgi:hypothetical protein
MMPGDDEQNVYSFFHYRDKDYTYFYGYGYGYGLPRQDTSCHIAYQNGDKSCLRSQ